MTRNLLAVACLTSLCMALPGCDRAAQAKRTADAESAAIPSPGIPAPVAPQPNAPSRGRWRFAPVAELAQVKLWVSHIQIRHQDAEYAGQVPFAPPDWSASSPTPSRTREQARRWAETLARDLKRNPDRFESYARRYSDDLSTRAIGGSLGGTTAAELSQWGDILDALAVLDAGGVSDVVETPFGFHVFRRRPAPQLETVSGSHIVIGYDQARWLHGVLARGPIPQRSRADALALANQLYQRATHDPGGFEALIDQYSEHEDAAYAGDVGSWSTHEITPYPREVEALAQVEIGAVAPPIDSLVGFQVLKRMPNRPRTELAMESLVFSFARNVAEGDPSSRTAVLATVEQLARELTRDPGRFDEFRKRHCCQHIYRWRQGPEMPQLDAALQRLGVGEIAAEPVVIRGQIYLPKRIDASQLPALQVRFELPAPENADVEGALSQMDPELARARLSVVANQARLSLDLGESRAGEVFEAHYHPWDAALDAALPDARRKSLLALDETLRQSLNREQYVQYRELLGGQVEESLLVPEGL
jgi:hypothetical protein